MKALVDNVQFESQPQAGTVVHLVKSLELEDDSPLRPRERASRADA